MNAFATCYRYLDEGIKILTAQAPDLHEALQRAVHLRPGPALLTMEQPGGCLDQQLQLPAVLGGREHHEPGQVNNRPRAAADNVNTHWGLL